MLMELCLLTSSIANWWASIEGNMINACMNSAVGIVVVFLSLLFFTFIISLFKYVYILDQKLQSKKSRQRKEIRR